MGAATRYHTGRLPCGTRGTGREHLCRACLNCDYAWAEALADVAGTQSGRDEVRPVTRVTVTCHGLTEILEFPTGRLAEATELERVNAELRAAGIEHPPGARGVHDLRGVLSASRNAHGRPRPSSTR